MREEHRLHAQGFNTGVYTNRFSWRHYWTLGVKWHHIVIKWTTQCARCNIYISHLCYDVSVCLSVSPSVCDGSALWSRCMPGRGERSSGAMLATARPSCYRFYSEAVLAPYYVVIVCLSVCVSATLRYCFKTAKLRIMHTMPHNSPGTRFLMPKIRAKFGQDHPLYAYAALAKHHTLTIVEHADFMWLYYVTAVSVASVQGTWLLGENETSQ